LNNLYYTSHTAKISGVSTFTLNLLSALKNDVNITYFPHPQEESFVKNIIATYSKFTTKQFDLIHFVANPNYSNSSAIMLRLSRVNATPTLLNIHGMLHIESMLNGRSFDDISHDLTNNLILYRLASKLVVNSAFMKNNVSNFYGINPDKIAIIPNGVNLEKFNNSHGQKKDLEGDPSILFLGLVSKLKGVDVLIEAVAKLRFDLPDLKLHIVGHGDDIRESLLQLIKRLHLENFVIFHGAADPATTPAYYKSADIFVHPSRYEGFGITILEAMASGIPIVASSIGSFTEILVNGQTALLFRREDPDDLAKALLSLAQDSALKKRLSQNGLTEVQNYSWQKISKKYVVLYEEMCNKS
jgi:1,4-alpha-glucan branching enzyme